ncbi:MAG TPA: hypothetical protein VGE02_09390 [Gemmatimonadales bacterium]
MARTLESLAGRVRDGEVELPSWMSSAGETATLAGLLAALLSAAPRGATRHAEGAEGGAGGEEGR